MIRRGTARWTGQLRGLLWAACCFACAYPIACGVCELLVRSGLTPKASVDAATVILALLLAPVPAVVFFATCAKHDALLTQRRARHQCLHCGYDVRATPERCPECGRRPFERGG